MYNFLSLSDGSRKELTDRGIGIRVHMLFVSSVDVLYWLGIASQ